MDTKELLEKMERAQEAVIDAVEDLFEGGDEDGGLCPGCLGKLEEAFEAFSEARTAWHEVAWAEEEKERVAKWAEEVQPQWEAETAVALKQAKKVAKTKKKLDYEDVRPLALQLARSPVLRPKLIEIFKEFGVSVGSELKSKQLPGALKAMIAAAH